MGLDVAYPAGGLCFWMICLKFFVHRLYFDYKTLADFDTSLQSSFYLVNVFA